MRAPKANEKAVPRQGRRGRSFVDWLAVAARFALRRDKRNEGKLETPRQWMQRRCGQRALAYPKPWPPTGGMRRDQVERKRKQERKSQGFYYQTRYARNARRLDRDFARMKRAFYEHIA